MALEDWVKGDGARIEIIFSEPITFFREFDPTHFIITSHEYNWVPGGTLVDVVKQVAHVYAKTLTVRMDDTAFTDGVANNGGILTLAPDYSRKTIRINFVNGDGIFTNTMIVDRKLYLGGDKTKKTIRKPFLLRDEGIWDGTVYANNNSIILAKGEE